MFHARLLDTLTAMGTPRKLDQHHWKRDTVWCTCRQNLPRFFFAHEKKRRCSVTGENECGFSWQVAEGEKELKKEKNKKKITESKSKNKKRKHKKHQKFSKNQKMKEKPKNLKKKKKITKKKSKKKKKKHKK